VRVALAVVALAPLLVPVPLRAQEGSMASIAGILDVTDPRNTATIRGPTPRVTVTRAETGASLPGERGLPLFPMDRVTVDAGTIVRLALRSDGAEGEVHSSSNLEEVGGAFVLDQIGGNERTVWEVGADPSEPGRIQLVVHSGTMAVNWFRQQLVLFVSGIRVLVSGTRLVVNVSEDGERAILYLIEGEVAFPDFPEVTIAAGQIAFLQAGLAPVVQVPPAAAAARMAEAAQWSSSTAWPGGFPWVWVGAGAGAAAASALVWAALRNRDGRERSGTVILQIPF
jgi:hypothetical protein